MIPCFAENGPADRTAVCLGRDDANAYRAGGIVTLAFFGGRMFETRRAVSQLP